MRPSWDRQNVVADSQLANFRKRIAIRHPLPLSRMKSFGTFLTFISVSVFLCGCSSSTEDPLKGDADTASGGLAAVLEKTPANAQIPLLRQKLNDSNPGLRYAAIEALAGYKDPSLAPDFEHAFQDSASIVRESAIQGLQRIDPKRCLPIAVAGLKDEDSWIQNAAIGQIEVGTKGKSPTVDKRLVPILMATLDGDNNFVSTGAMAILRKLTGQEIRYRQGMSADERRGVVQKWKHWWQANRAKYPMDPELGAITAIRPTRSDPAPNFSLPDLGGKEFSLAGQKGRVTLINFWGTWCPPCRQEIPGLVNLDSRFGAKGLDVVGVAMSEKEGALGVKKFAQSHAVGYRLVLGNAAIQEAFGEVEELPVSVLIDRKGQIRYRWEGDRDLGTFQKAVERLLAE